MKYDDVYTTMEGLVLNEDENDINNEIYSSIIDLCLCERRESIKHIIVNKSITYKGQYIAKGEILQILDASNDAGGGMNVKSLSTGECLYLPCYVEGDFSEYVNNSSCNGIKSKTESPVDNDQNDSVTEEDVYDYVYARHGRYSPKKNENYTKLNREAESSEYIDMCGNLPRSSYSVFSSSPPIKTLDEKEKKKLSEMCDRTKLCTNNYVDMQSYGKETKNVDDWKNDFEKERLDSSYTSFRDRYVAYCSKKQLKLSTLKIDDVVNLLTSLSLDHHSKKIRDDDIDGGKLVRMSEMDICTTLLFTRFEARLLSAALSGWTPISNSAEKNWTEKENKQFSTHDLYSYLTSVGYRQLADYLIRYKVDGSLFQSLLSDDLLSTLELSDGTKLQKLALKELQMRFNYS